MNPITTTIIITLFVLLISAFAFSDTITDYQVPSSVPLNQPITATGVYWDDSNTHSIVLCSFYILEDGKIVYRETDQYSTATGRFAMNGRLLTEPLTVRGEEYTLRSECGTATVDSNFKVDQKQEAINVFGFNWYPQGSMLDLLYLRDNSWFLFGFFIILFFFIALIALGVGNFFE